MELTLQYIRLITHSEFYEPGQKKKQRSEQDLKKIQKAKIYKEKKQQKEQAEEHAGVQKQKKWQDFMSKSGIGKQKDNIFKPREKAPLLSQTTNNSTPTSSYSKQNVSSLDQVRQRK